MAKYHDPEKALRMIRKRYGTLVGDLIDLALEGGAVIKPTRSGIIIRFPDGKSTVVFHLSPSDGRGKKNAASDIRRILFRSTRDE